MASLQAAATPKHPRKSVMPLPTMHPGTNASIHRLVHPQQLPGAQYNYPDILVHLIRGPTASLILGTPPNSSTYHIPTQLLCWHSIYFTDKLRGSSPSQADSGADRKRKFSTGEESTIGGDHGHSSTGPSAEVSEPILELPNVEAKVFELFLKFAYMGWYPFEIDALIPDRRMTNNLPQRTSPYSPVQARDLGQLEGSVDQSRADTAAEFSNNTLPATASPTVNSPTQSSTIPPSVSAWLFAMSIGAFRFANHAMLHIHSGIGSYFQLTPHPIHFIWQHTPQHSILRRLIIDILLVHWTGSSATTQCINRHPALNQHWMRLFDSHTDLKSLFVLGLGSRKEVMAPEAYFVYPQMPKVAPPVSIVKPLGSEDSGEKEGEDVKPPQHGDGEEVVAAPSKSKNKAAVVKSEEVSTDEGETSDAEL